ncbi:hypothetical protein KHA80_10455 [Anaerobacillus sp. HL2]|nr:hypothetical protein KHA80_10455 [Anaerobacillus sp. HL2]
MVFRGHAVIKLGSLLAGNGKPLETERFIKEDNLKYIEAWGSLEQWKKLK